VDNQKVEVTREYLFKHRTKKGSWTRHQIQALGIDWPPRSGWIEELVGTWINLDQAREFEIGREIMAGKEKLTFAKVCEFIKLCTAKELATIRNIITQRKL